MLLRLLAKVFPSRPPQIDDDLEPIRLHLTGSDGEILGSTWTRSIYDIEFDVEQAGVVTDIRDNKYQKLWILQEPKAVVPGYTFTFVGRLRAVIEAA